MNVIQRQQLLVDKVNSFVSGFIDYASSSEQYQQLPVKDLIQITRNTDKFLEFKFLTHRICMMKEIEPMRGIANLKTYKVVVDKDNFSKNKLEPLDNTDVATTILDESSPARTISVFVKEFLRGTAPNSKVEVSAAGIVNFNTQYLNALFKVFS